MSSLDNQERFLYFRTAERITDLPAFKKSLGKRIELFPTPPKYYAEDPDTGKYLYKVKVNLTRRFFLKPAGGYRPGQYYVDHIISAYYSDDIAKVAEVLITHPETILELEELGIYDRSITIEDLLKDKAAAHGIDVKVVQEKVETFLEQEAQGHPQDLPTEVNQILSTLDEKTTSVAVKNNQIILNQGMMEYYQSQREKQQQELERLKQEALDPAQRLTMSYQELEREQMAQILGGASPERAIQRLNALYSTQGFDQQQRLDLLQRLIGPSLGNLEFDMQNQSIKLTGLSAYASANVEEVSRISKLHDSQRLAPLPPPRGFISRPTAETYRSLFAMGNVKGVHFQLQEETVLADLLTADPSRQIELLTQGMDPSKIEDSTARSIFLANEVYASLDLSVSQKLGIEPRITRIYYDYSFHPKIGYVYHDTDPNRQINAAYIGTQNLTAALERKHSVENIMVFRPDSQYQVESKIARQIVLATDLLHEHAAQVLSGQSRVVDRNAIKRDYNYFLSVASAGKRVSKALSLLPAHLRGLVPRLGKKYVYFNEEVQDRMLHTLKEVFGSKGDVNTKVVLSFGDISALYATGDNQIKSVIRGVLTSGQASRLKILTSQDQLFSYLETTQGQSSLVKDLVAAGVIQVVPTGLHHDKSYAVFRGSQLVALGTGSSNLSLTSRFHDVEVGVYVGALDQPRKNELSYLSSIQHQVSAYYESLLTNSQNTLFTAENTSNLQATQLLYESLSKLQEQMGSEAFTIGARYDLNRSSSLAAGVIVKFGGRNLVFTVNQSGQVVIANDKRVIGGSIFKNDTKADWVLDLPGMKRSLKPGEAVALNSMQTALSLVGSISTAMRLEYNYGTVNSAFAKMGQERMIVALDNLMGDLMTKYTGVAGDSVRGILTNIWEQDHAGMGDRVRQFQKALFKTITAVAAQMYSATPMMTPFKDGLPVDYSQRSRVLFQLFKPIFDIDPTSERALLEILEVWDDVRDRLVGRLSSETGGIASSFLLQDLKLRLLQYDDYGISLLQSHRQSLLNQVISAMTSAFLPSHEAGGSAAQRAARLVYYSVGQHYSTSSLNTQELYGAMGFAFTNPGVLKHGQDIGLPPGSVFRSLSSTAFPSYTDYHNLDLLRILATTDGEYAGAAVVYDSHYAFKAGPALQYRTEQEYYDYALQYLQSVGADTNLLSKPSLPDRRLFLLPFSKPEQITQRLKNYFGAKQMFEVSPKFLRALLRGDFGVSMRDYVKGEIATSVSQVQYEELMALMQSGRKDISDYYRQQLIQNESAISGFIKGASMRRVAFALGYGQYGDTIYANEAFFDKRLFGSTHTFNIRLNPQGFNQPQQFAADLKSKLAGAVVYTQNVAVDPQGEIGRQIVEVAGTFLDKYGPSVFAAKKRSSRDRVDKILSAVKKKLTAFLKYQYKFADVDFKLSYSDRFEIELEGISLRKGVYNYVDGKFQRVFEFDQQGRIRLAGQSTSTNYAMGLDELSISLPGYSRRYSNAVAMIDPNINVVVSGNMLVLQGNSYVVFRPSTGDRGGEGYQVKGPLQIINRTVFDTIHGNFAANEFRGVRAGLQNKAVMAILHPGLTKGFTYESGLDLIAEDSSRLTLLDTMRARSLDTLLSVTLLLGAGKQSQKLREAFVSAYSLQGDTRTAQLIKYGWEQFTTSKSRTNLIQQAFGLIKLAGGGDVSPDAVLDRIRERLLVSLTDDNARTSLLADITNLISSVASSSPSFSPGLRTSNEGDFDVRAAGLLADAFSITTQILHNRPLDLQGKHLTEISLVDASNQPKLAQYKQDEQYRLKVQSIMTRLGVAYSDLPRLPNESDTDYQRRNDEALANKMQFVQLLLNRQIFVERAVAYNPSRLLAATGMKDTVGLEYHYMAGMSAKQYHRLTSYMPGLTKDDYTTLASAYAILTQINVHTDALSEFQAMRLRSTIVPDIDADIGNRLVTNFTEFAYDAPVFAGDRQTTIFEATMEKVLSASTEADKLAAVEAYEHLAKLALGKDDTDSFDAKSRLSKFLADQQTSDALKVLGISISYTPNLEEKGAISSEVLKQNKLLEDILTRSLQLGPERVAPALSAIDDTNRISSGLLAIQTYGEKTGNKRLQDWARTTTLQMLPSFLILPTDDGNFKLRFLEDAYEGFMKQGYEYGVMLGTDVLSSVVLTSPGYAGGPATNQLKMRQLEPQVRAILSTYEVSNTLTPHQASLLMEYRRLMQESVTDTISLATTEYSRRVTGEGLPNPGMSATAISGYLADIGEVFVGGMRTNHMMPQIAQMIANLEKIHAGVASGKVTDAKSVLKAHLYKRLKSKGLDRVVASMFRAGGPSFASVINQEHEVGSIEELIRRAESNNSALGLARGYAGQAVYMPSVGRFFTQGADFDGDSYAFMLNRERYFNEYVSLVMQDLEEREKLLGEEFKLFEMRKSFARSRQTQQSASSDPTKLMDDFIFSQLSRGPNEVLEKLLTVQEEIVHLMKKRREIRLRLSGQSHALTKELADLDKQIEYLKNLVSKHTEISSRLSEKATDISGFSQKSLDVVKRYLSIVNTRRLRSVVNKAASSAAQKVRTSSPTAQEVQATPGPSKSFMSDVSDLTEFVKRALAEVARFSPSLAEKLQVTPDHPSPPNPPDPTSPPNPRHPTSPPNPPNPFDPFEDIDSVITHINKIDAALVRIDELADQQKELKRRLGLNLERMSLLERSRKVDTPQYEKIRAKRSSAVNRRISTYRSSIEKIDDEIASIIEAITPSMSYALDIKRRLDLLRQPHPIQQDKGKLSTDSGLASPTTDSGEGKRLTDSGLASPTTDSGVSTPTSDQASEEVLDFLKDPRILEYEKLVDPRILEYEKRLQEFQSAFQEQQKKIDSDIRRWTASYTGLPQTFFADAGDGAFTLAEVMHLNEQFRGISTLSDMGENQDAKRLMRYVEIFGELGGTVPTTASAQQMIDTLRSHDSYAALLQEDRERIKDYITAAYGNNEYSYDKGKSVFESYIADQIQRLRSLSATNTKVFGNAAGTVIDAATFDALQAVIGTQGTSLIGEAYNAITPLMYSGISNFAFSFALKGSSSQLLSAFRGVADTENAIEMQLIAKLEGVDFSEVVTKADRRWKAISGLLGNVQQIARDSLKEKTSKGVLDRLTQQVKTEDGRTMTLAEYIQDPEASSEERQLRVKNFMSVEDGGLKSFGAIFLLSDYMKASSLDLEQLVKAKPGDDLRMWLSSQYELAGRPVDVDTFMASTILNQLQRVSAEFSVGKMLADGNIDYIYEGFAKRATANLRAADTSIAYESLSDYERLLRDTGDVFNEQYISAFRDFPNLTESDDRRNELERRLMQLHDYEANREGGVSVDMIKFLRQLRNQRSFTEGEEAVVQTMEYLQRGKLSPIEHQGILARMMSSAEANDYDNPLSNYLAVVSSEVIKDMHLTEAESKLFADLMVRGEKGSRPVDILTQYSAGVSEWVRMQDELNIIQQQMNDPDFVKRSQIEQESLMRRKDYLVEQSVIVASDVPYLLDMGKHRLQDIQQNADNLNTAQQTNLDMETRLQSAEADWLHEVNVRKQLDVAQGVGIWGGPLLVALLAGNDFRPDERTAMAAVDIFQSIAIMQAGMSPDAALTSSRFRRARMHNAARSEGETFGSLQGFATELFMSSVSKLSQDVSDTLANRFQTHGAAIGLATEFLGTFASLGLSRAFSYLNPSPYHDVSTDDFIRSLQGMFIVRAWNTWQEALQQPEEEVEYQDPEDVLAYLEFKPATSAEEMQAIALNPVD